MKTLAIAAAIILCSEHLASAQTMQGQVYWYYCDSAHAYSPYVKSCPEPWRAVLPQSVAPAVPAMQQRPQAAVVCELGQGSATKFVTLTPTECDRQNAKIRADAQAREAEQHRIAEQNAATERQQADDERRRRVAATAAQVERDRQDGYKTITFEDFALDGKELAESGQKIIIQGAYIRIGHVDYLMPSTMAIAMMAELGRRDQGIGLLVDDAPREVRRRFLNCRENLVAMQTGCAARIAGHVISCEHSDLVGKSVIPCINVEDLRDIIN